MHNSTDHFVTLPFSLKSERTISFKKSKGGQPYSEQVLTGCYASVFPMEKLCCPPSRKWGGFLVLHVRARFQKAFTQITLPLLGFNESTLILDEPNIVCKSNVSCCQTKYLAKQYVARFFGLQWGKQVGRLQVGYRRQKTCSFQISTLIFIKCYPPTPIKRNVLSL